MKTRVLGAVGCLVFAGTALRAVEPHQEADEWCYPVSPFRHDVDVDGVVDLIHCPAELITHWSPKEGYFFRQSNGWNEKTPAAIRVGEKRETGWHYGVDFSGATDPDGDIGDPVLAAANGFVEYSFVVEGPHNWGTTCVLRHHLPDGRTVWTVYAHLLFSECPKNRFIPKGKQIGAIGDANGYYRRRLNSENKWIGGAHLHFEIRTEAPVASSPDDPLEERIKEVLGNGYSLSRFPLVSRADPYPWSDYADPIDFVQTPSRGSAPAPCARCPILPGPFDFRTALTTPMLIDNEPAVKLEWLPSSNVGYYRVKKIHAVTNEPLAGAHLLSATEFIDTKVDNGQTVRYEIEAVNDSGVTTADSTVTVTPNVIQDPPRHFMLLSGASQCLNYQPAAFLWWTASQGADTYNVLRNGALVAVGIREREFSDFDIEEGIAYTYEVRAENPSGSRVADNTVSWLVPAGACDAPNPPTAVTNEATVQNTFDVLFKGTFNANGAASVYFFEWGSQSSSYPSRTTPRSFGAGTADQVWTLTTFVGCDRTIYYRGVAENTGGTAHGQELSLTMPPCTIPAPSDLTVVLNEDHVVALAWTDNSANESTFIITRTNPDSSPATLFADENATGTSDNLVAWPDGQYCYTVAGHNVDLGTGEPSNEACVTLPYQSGSTGGGGGGGVQTTYAFYPTMDGQVRSPSTPGSWDRQRNSSSGRDPMTDGASLKALVTLYNGGAGLISVVRTLLSFDTSGLPDTATVVSATLHVSVLETEDHFNDEHAWVSVFSAGLASPMTLSASDFSACGETAGAEQVDVTEVAVGGQPFVLNPTGLAWINPAGFTTLCLREGHDADDIFISANVGTWKGTGIALHASESGSASRPYLEVVVEE